MDQQTLISALENGINSINQSLEWIQQNRQEKYDQVFIQLMEERRKLSTLRRALDDNPAITAYGISQTGKSYLISNLLQTQKAFTVAGEDGKEYDFVHDMNPDGGGKEATGVVTRFTSFNHHADRFCPLWPIMARTLTVSDIVIVICEGLYNNTTAVQEDQNKVQEIGERLLEQYRNCPLQPNPRVKADDILDIKRYFKNYLRKASSYNNTDIFNNIALIIERVPEEDYCSVFSKLWQDNQTMTQRFLQVYGLLKKLGFARNIYIPVEAVLKKGVNKNTILSVECLDMDNDSKTFVMLKNGEGQMTRVDNVYRRDLAALCAEVVYKIGDEFMCYESRYDKEMIKGNDYNLTDGIVTRDILKDNDLLDFPGAKSYENNNVHALSQPDIYRSVYLRGKVSYLFNKYSEAKLINVLMYCHDAEDRNVATVWEILENWVHAYIGSTPEARADKVAMFPEQLAPLFYIATKFNTDMIYDKNQDNAYLRGTIDNRWNGRFDNIVLHKCFGGSNVKWYKNWTREGDTFNNSYLLRDFKYSDECGGHSNLYRGFDQTSGTPEKELVLPHNYYDQLRTSFCESAVVKGLFKNPALSWDVAATIRNDGSLRIIEQLSKVAQVLWDVRLADFSREARKIMNTVYGTISTEYVPDDPEAKLQQHFETAKQVITHLDATCDKDGYYFGHFIKNLQLTEALVKDEIRDLIGSGKLNSEVNDNHDNAVIRESLGKKLAQCSNDDERWDVVVREGAFHSREEAEDFYQSRGINMQDIFSGQVRKKINSVIIADDIFNKWCDRVLSANMISRLTDDGKPTAPAPGVITAFIKNMLDKSRQVFHLPDMMADKIAEFTDVINTASINQSLVADILSSIISDYVVDLGYSMLSQKQKDDLAAIRQKYEDDWRPVTDHAGKVRKSIYGNEEIAALFNVSSSSKEEEEKPSSSFRESYEVWKEYMFISFVSNIAPGEGNPEANAALKSLMDKIKAII